MGYKNFKNDLTGMQFNHLKVLTFNYTTKKWLCKCSWNNIVEVETKNLTSERVKSCGCKKYIRNNNKEGNYPKLSQIYYHIKSEEGAEDWKDLNDFKQWSLDNGWIELLHYKKIIKGKPYSKQNLVFGIKYNSKFLPIKEAKDWKIYYNQKNEEFLIRFRYNKTTIKKEHIKTVSELCTQHIKLYKKYFHKKSFFE